MEPEADQRAPNFFLQFADPVCLGGELAVLAQNRDEEEARGTAGLRVRVAWARASNRRVGVD